MDHLFGHFLVNLFEFIHIIKIVFLREELFDDHLEFIVRVCFTQCFLEVHLDLLSLQCVAVVSVNCFENFLCTKLECLFLVYDNLVNLVLFQVAQQSLLGVDFVDTVLLGVVSQNQFWNNDSHKTAQHQRYCVDLKRSLVWVLVSQVRDDEPAEGAQECTQEVRVGISIPCEHVCVLGLRQQLEDLV